MNPNESQSQSQSYAVKIALTIRQENCDKFQTPDVQSLLTTLDSKINEVEKHEAKVIEQSISKSKSPSELLITTHTKP